MRRLTSSKSDFVRAWKMMSQVFSSVALAASASGPLPKKMICGRLVLVLVLVLALALVLDSALVIREKLLVVFDVLIVI